ncbi:MAG: sugar transferase [Clostridia bacterium]|nr:sugar transferase [Clostridia bacterium]
MANNRHSFYRKYGKRFLDLICSGLMLLVIWPLLIIIMVIIKLDSKGPAIFVQERLGLHGKVFKMYKARTMCNHAEQQGSGAYAFQNDARITRVGRVLRKLSLDELFQLINVFKGDMSFIGPRPILTYHPCTYDEYTEKEKTVFHVRPGISGWAQVNGRNSIDWVQRFELNEWYVENVSLALDIRIVFMSIVQVFSRKEIEIQENTAEKFQERRHEAAGKE